MPFSLNIILYSFWFKVRDVRLFLSLEHLEAIVGLLTGLISILLCLREQGGLRRGRETWVGGAVRTHITFIDKVRHLIWVLFMVPQNNYSSNIKDHWSQITITNIIIVKKFEILWELPKCDLRHEVSKPCWKMAPMDLFNAGLPQTFNL